MYNPFGIFTPDQRRNIALYIVGIMLYKFALEYFNGLSNPIHVDCYKLTLTQVHSLLWQMTVSETELTRRLV
jgi:hypothetical protein